MKKQQPTIVAVVALCAILLAGLFVPVLADTLPQDEWQGGYDYERFKNDKITLNVYNWGEYISDASTGGINVNKAFEELTGIKVNYTLFDTNEALHSKLKSGGASYDVIVPSDYMIGRMINEEMLAPLNFDNIPNYQLIGEAYKDQAFDPDNAYSVPYTWGYVGLVYNTTMVDETVDSWDILWSQKYQNNILMFDNPRDAFAIALIKLGYSLNPTDEEQIDQAATELQLQKGVVQAYVMDQIYDKMGGGEAAVAPYYAGDVITMMQDNQDLAFAVPKEGTNYFIDSMCIPAGSPNKEAAEMYINFMCETAIARDNSLAIGYSTPQVEAKKALPKDIQNNPIAYPPDEVLENTEVFNVLPEELNAYMAASWRDMRTAGSGNNGWIIIVFFAVSIVFIVASYVRRRVKQKRDDY